MRIAVMGSGRVGGFFGGLLARAGEDVAFIARGAHLDALRARGLTVQSRVIGDFARAVSATDDPATIGPVDLVLLCVKTYLASTRRRRDPPSHPRARHDGPADQNGIDASPRLVQTLGPASVLRRRHRRHRDPRVAGAHRSPGAQRKIVFGEYPSGVSRVPKRVRDALQRAGVTTELHPGIRVPLWEKLVVLAASGGAMWP